MFRSARCLCSNVGLGSVQAWLLDRSVAQGIPIGPKVYCDHRRITTVRHVFFSFLNLLMFFFPQCLIDLEDGQMTISTVEHAAMVCDLSLDGRCLKPFWTSRQLDFDMMSLRPSSSTWCPFCPFGHESNLYIWCPFGYHLTLTGPLVAYFFGPPKNTSGIYSNFTCQDWHPVEIGSFSFNRWMWCFTAWNGCNLQLMLGAVFIWGKVPTVGRVPTSSMAVCCAQDGLTCSM